MEESTLTALTTFATQVTSSVSAIDVLTILGKAVAGGFAIYIVQWGAKKIVRTFVRSMNGSIGV